MRRRRSVAAAGALAIVAAATACAPAGDPSWKPPAWGPSRIEVVASGSIRPVDEARVRAALVSERLRDDAVGIQARVALLPGDGAVAAAYNDAALQPVRDAIAASGVAYSPAPHPAGAGLADRWCVPGSSDRAAAELISDPAFGVPGGAGAAIVCDVVAAAGSVLAQRIRTVTGTPEGVTGDTTTTLYVDTATGQVALAGDLWAEDAAERLRADVVEALRRAAGALTSEPPSPGDEAQLDAIRRALGSTVPAAEGGLAFTLPAGFTAPELAALGASATSEPLTISVPPDIAEPLVSGIGRSVLASAGLPFSLPAAGPAGLDRVACDLFPCAALTYDDGPTGLTPALLDVLADERVAATFYMLGGSAAGNPDVVRRVAAEGHEIGNHTWSHPHLPVLDDAAVASELGRTRDLLRSLSGQPVASFRPPYGEFTARVLDVAAQPAILWDIDTRDWAGPSDAELRASAVDGARAGSIILFHDTHERSVRVAPDVIDGLQDRGFRLVTVTQLFGGRLPDAGAWRAAR